VIGARVVALAASAEKIARRQYRAFGKGESHLDHALAGLVAGVAGASIHYQVSFPETLIKLVVRDPVSADAAADRLAALDRELRTRLGDVVYSEGNDGMPVVLGRVLAHKGATLAVAESCTAGMLGALITEVPGSSAWFAGGWITYANEMKVQQLGVREDTLRTHGAVSREAVIEMAAGARARAGTTFAAAVSGIAGPGGGTPDKPVGTVHVAVVGPTGEPKHKTFVYPGARDQVRRLAAYWAMSLVIGAVNDG
jgi:nicotinamide-nucleotide amidase